MDPALGAAAGLGMWFVGVAVLPLSGYFQLRRRRWATIVHRPLPLCEWPVLGIPLGTARNIQPLLQCAAGQTEPAVRAAAAVLDRWFVEVTVMPLPGVFS